MMEDIQQPFLDSQDIYSHIQQTQVYNYDDLFPALPDVNFELDDVEICSPIAAKPRIESSFVTQLLEIPIREMRYGDLQEKFGGQSEKAKICAEIMHITKAKIEVSSSKNHSMTFLITGKVEAVKEACNLISEKLQIQAPTSVSIPKMHHRHILGKQGKKLKDLEKLTGTRIIFPRFDDNSEIIQINGPKEGILKAIEEMKQISLEQFKNFREEIIIPFEYQPFIKGADNVKLREIMTTYNVLITSSTKKDTLIITGDETNVIKAKEEKRSSTVTANMSKDKHKYLIGVKGSKRAEFLQKFNVSVELPPTDSDNETITLRGLPENLGEALSFAYSQITNVKSADVEVPLWLHKYIIGKKGCQIQQFTQNFPKICVKCAKEQDLIRIEGPSEDVDKVKDELQMKVDDLLNKFAFSEITFQSCFLKQLNSHPDFIKMKRSGIVKDVAADGKIGTIRLEGLSEDIVKAKSDLDKLLHKIEVEEHRQLSIDRKFHRNIIGPKGEKIKELRELFNVKIIIPDLDSKQDNITVIGHKFDVEKCCNFIKELCTDFIENSHKIEIQIPKDHYQYFISNEGFSKIRQIEERTQTKSRLDEDDSGNGLIKVTGKKENVEEAKELIKQLQKTTLITKIIIPHKFHSVLIGSGGKLIKSVEEECDVKIYFPSVDSGSDKVTIIGSKDSVSKAKKILVDMSNEKQLNNYTEEFRAKPEIHKFIMGKSRCNIRKIKETYNVRIIFPSENDADKFAITLIGKKEAVKSARAELEIISKNIEKEITEEVRVDPKYHRHFISRNAKVLKEIREKCDDVRIQFPERGTQDDCVVIKGMKESVTKAKQLILNIVENLEQRITVSCIIPNKAQKILVTSKRDKVFDIMNTYDVEIKFFDRQIEINGSVPFTNGVLDEQMQDEKPCDVITFTGKPENCDAAKTEILYLIPITKKINVPFDLHRYIIGKKGEEIRNLMKTYQVSISTSSVSDQSDIIQVSGLSENVDKACEDILLRVSNLKMELEDREARKFQQKITVDPKYHSRLIGRKGEVINKIKDKYNVLINFPKKNEIEEDIITITGYEKNALEAANYMCSLVQEFENMIEKEVLIDQRFRPRLIGQKGRNIKRLMDQFKVEIRFPKPGEECENPDIAYISGQDENVAEAEIYIMALAEEFLQDIAENEFLEQYIRYNKDTTDEPKQTKVNGNNESSGFLVKGGPWDQKSADSIYDVNFPCFGKSCDTFSLTPWGPNQ